MPLKIYKPTSPGRRKMSTSDFSVLTKKKPEKNLVSGKKSQAGRNSSGHISVRRRGGGHKRRNRAVDFNRTQSLGVPATVKALEYDPNRTAWIALIVYADGRKSYILAPESLKVDDQVVCAERTKVKPGNRMQLKHIPTGFKIYNLELLVGHGGSVVRSAGSSATLVSLDGSYAQVRLPSGEVRYVPKECFASIGTVSHGEHSLIKIGKAGRMRWLGRRPKVLGKSMNAADHPHGGGEGHSPIGLVHPKTPWGKPAHGVKTRKKKNPTSRWIVRRRPKKRRRKG